MNFDFSEEQKMLQEQARRLLSEKCPPERVRKVLEGDEFYAKDVWDQFCALGAAGAAIPEEYGGLGLGPLELCVLAEELGRAAAPVPFISSICLAAEGIRLGGSEEIRKKWLPELASGQKIGALADAEGKGRPNWRTLQTRIENGRLTGDKWPVADGMAADLLLVTALENGEPVLALVEAGDGGVSREPVKTIDPARDHARVRFDGASAVVLGEAGSGKDLLARLLNFAAVVTSFEQIGGSEAALQMARTYALERYAFGRQIGSFQAIKHKLADGYIRNQLARANSYYAAMALADDSADLPAAAACARISASEAYRYMAQENVQTHGGIGFTWESDCQFFYRRSKVLALSLGSPMVWREKLVRALEQSNQPA